jgi:uncharacterized repeat protein (TIGR04138 family)
MQEVNFDEVVGRIVQRDTRYSAEAYTLVREALDFTQRRANKKNRGRLRHVSGPELLEGVRDYVLQEYGPLALTVLEEWGIRCTRDIGEIVFNMVEHRLLAKTDDDNLADFEGTYDFKEAFVHPFLPSSKRTPPPPVRAVKPKSSEPKA